MKNARKYLKELIRKKEELEKRMDVLNRMREGKKITEEEYKKERKKIEKEFIEVMDRLAQIKYIVGQDALY